MEIIQKDISEEREFSFAGDTIKLERCLDQEKRIYLFSRYNAKGRLVGYELVQGVKHKNPDGEYVYIYPSSSQFGHYGYFINKAYADKDIPEYLEKLRQKNKKTKQAKSSQLAI